MAGAKPGTHMARDEIILYTARGDVKGVLKAEGQDCIGKPVSTRRLFAIVPSDTAGFRVRPCLMPSFGFPKYGGEGATAEGEALLDVPGDGNLGTVAGYSVALAEDPHDPGAVIDLENSASKSAEGFAYPTGDRHLFMSISSGIAINVLNRGARGTACEQERSHQDKRACQKSSANLQYRFLHAPPENTGRAC